MSIIDVDYFPTYFYFLLWDNLSRGWLWRGIIDIKIYMIQLNIRKYRRKKGITQQELADLADLSHGYIRDIESINMGVTFSLDAVEKIANALDVKIKDMFEEEKEDI